MKYTTLFMALLLGSSVQAATTGWQSSLLTTGSSQRKAIGLTSRTGQPV